MWSTSFSAVACPAVLYSSDFKDSLTSKRNELMFWVLSSERKNSWVRRPLQVDPINGDGRFEFFKDESWFENSFDENDRIIFRVEHLGRKMRKEDKFPCKSDQVWRVQDVKNRKKLGYIFSCKLNDTGLAKYADLSQKSYVHYDKKKALIQSKAYKYSFNPENHMLFKSIGLLDGEKVTSVAFDSNIMIRANLKHFFTFHFDADDIESVIQDVRIGPLGANARVTFYLKVFYIFTIRLALTTDVSFFEDAANIPMVIHIPEGAEGKLKENSGIIYSWNLRSDPLIKESKIGMPVMSDAMADTINSGSEAVAKVGKKSCYGSSQCWYRYGLKANNTDLIMDFKINRSMVDKGFFPIYMEKISEYNKRMDWQINYKAGQEPRGFYFETSGLKPGAYPWGFWLGLGGEEDRSKNRCPRPLYLKKIK